MKKMKYTLKRKLNPSIRYDGGRKFFFPTKYNTHKCFTNLFPSFYACKISDTNGYTCFVFSVKRHISHLQKLALCKEQELR